MQTRFSISFSKRKALVGLSLLALSCAASAQEADTASSLRISGFATLGITHNDNKEMGAIFSSSQRHPVKQGWSSGLDSVVGLQADWQIREGTSVTVQGVARAGSDGEPELRLAYLRQQLTNETALRVGRIRSPLFFDSDVAEIGYAYLMVRPPLALYGTMNSTAAMDGGDLQWRHSFGDVAFMAQAYYGNYGYKHRFYNLSPVETADANLENIRGLALTASLPKVTVRASRTWVDRYTMRSNQVSQLNAGLEGLSAGLRGMAAMMPPMAANLLSEADQIAGYKNIFDNKPIYTSLGFDSTLDNWRLLGEWTQLDSQSKMVGKYEGFHLTTGYSFGDFTPYVSVSRFERKSKALDTSAFAPTGLPLPAGAIDGNIAMMKAGLDQAAAYANLSTRSISYGVRWDCAENMAVKVQYDRMKTPNNGVPGYFAVGTLPVTNNNVNLFTVALDVVF